MNPKDFKFCDQKLVPDPVLSVAGTEPSQISMYTGTNEMLRVAEDGFYVRGKRVPADDEEALSVYKAFKEFLVYHGLTAH
jgi:hypothetical protein